MKAVHARLRGFTASIRVPFLISGTQLCCPLPPYSTILGLLGCCAGCEVTPEEVRIGFQYSYDNETIDPVETLQRLGIDAKTGRLFSVKDRGIGQRGFHVDPVLDLYVIGEHAMDWLMHPVGVPCLGRSQDIAWISSVAEVDMQPVESGKIKGTWLPFSPDGPSGKILRFAEYYRNDCARCVRRPGPSQVFVALTDPSGTLVTHKNLYVPTDAEQSDEAIYVHSWTFDD